MGNITLRQAAQWCGGEVDPKYADITFLGANNDTRKLEPGQLFVALQGARDGHDFIPMALEKGATAVLCSRCEGDFPAIVVSDTRKALGDIARGERQRIGMQVVGVTGSVGKSTTKEMIACVLQGSYRVAKTPANHNNDIGMPMAILSMGEDTQVAVLEMGMNHAGEIAYLSRIACPDVAVIVNVGTMHIEHLGSRENIRKAKMEITQGMQPTGLLLLNGDDDMLWGSRKAVPQNTAWFGWENPECQTLGQNILESDGRLLFDACRKENKISLTLPVEGKHHVTDSLAAVAVGLALGVAPEKIARRLAEFQNMEGRQEIFRAGEYTIFKDCYNAGPESVAAALQVLGNRTGRKVAVLGDMLELGDHAAAAHEQAGRLAAQKAQLLLALGSHAEDVVRGALDAGMKKDHALAFESREALVQTLKSLAQPGDVILFKGSRGMRMELALEAFLRT